MSITSSSSSPSSPSHPLLAAAATMHATLDDVAGTDPLYLSVGEKSALLVELTTALTRLAALRAEVLAVADDVALDHGARSAGTWLAGQPHLSRREAVHDERLGSTLRH